MSNYIPLFVGCVLILVSVMPGPIMRGRLINTPLQNQKRARIVAAVLGFTILLSKTVTHRVRMLFGYVEFSFLDCGAEPLVKETTSQWFVAVPLR
jgi:hypothetical protein